MRVRDGDDCLACEYCKSVHLPEKSKDGVALLRETSNFQCPLCAVPLEHALIGRYRTLYCIRCHGNLISMPVFVSLVEHLRAQQGDAWEIPPPPDPQRLRRRIHCPQCKQTMDTHYYCGPGNVIIDDCDRCELNWLDNGELMRIVRAPDHSLENSPSW
ncbi:MAG: zf-TFIIB domain-containing protein [Acidobacteriaceae bacterium]|nr:zf-TFIIB domain-containing protein [Acidobacteriaceae bacterium]